LGKYFWVYYYIFGTIKKFGKLAKKNKSLAFSQVIELFPELADFFQSQPFASFY